ncbi:MAG: hypothetical protein DSY53_04705 [Persephonella sp.]|nr:MAG: hypothetical protein DSY53_04705 [Persephonella sp.]
MEELKNIDLFLYRISSSIRERGKRILKNNLIIDFRKTDEGFKAEVRSESYYNIYEVEIFVSDGNIIDATCSCPYYEDYDDYCKHIAASIFYLQKNFNSICINKEKKTKKYKDYLKEYLNNLPKGELIRIILDYSRKDKNFLDYLEILINSSNLDSLKKKIDKVISDLNKYYKNIEFENSYVFINLTKSLDEILSAITQFGSKEYLNELVEHYYKGLIKLTKKYFSVYSYPEDEINDLFNLYFKYLIKTGDLDLFKRKLDEVLSLEEELGYYLFNEKYVANLLFKYANYKNVEKVLSILEKYFTRYTERIIHLVEKFFPKRKVSYYYKYKDKPDVLRKLIKYLEEREDYYELEKVLYDFIKKIDVEEDTNIIDKYFEVLEKIEHKEKLKKVLIDVYTKTLRYKYLEKLFNIFKEDWEEIKAKLNKDISLKSSKIQTLHKLNLAILEKNISIIKEIIDNLYITHTRDVIFIGDFIINAFRFAPEEALELYLRFAKKILKRDTSLKTAEKIAFQISVLNNFSTKKYKDRLKENLINMFPKRRRLRLMLEDV